MHANTFHRYQGGRLLVILGSEAQALAVSWQVYQYTHSALSLGWTGLWLLLPGLLFFSIAGYVADHFDRKQVIFWAYATQAVFTGLLLFLSLRPMHSVLPIYALLFCIGTGRCFSGPASSALLPMLVPDADLVKAVTWGATIFQIANVAGPLMGGLLFTVQGGLPARWQGGPVVYSFTLVTICSFLVVLLSMRVEGLRRSAATMEGFALLAGFRFILASRDLLGPILLDLFATLFGGALTLMPIFATDMLHVGATGLGLLRAAPAVGALVVSVARLRKIAGKQPGGNLVPSMAVFSMATMLFAWSRWTWLSMAALALIGASQMMNLLIRTSLVQAATPTGMRGRVGAISWVLLGTSNELGGFESGLTAHWFGAVRAVALGGFASLLLTGAAHMSFGTGMDSAGAKTIAGVHGMPEQI